MGEARAASFAGARGLAWTADPAEADWVREVLAPDPDGVARLPGATEVKRNPVRSVWRVPRPGRDAVYVKRFRVSALRDAAKHLFVPSRARAEWDASAGLRAAGLPAAEVVAFAERRAGPFLRDAACVVREFPDARELVPWMFRRWGQEGPWSAEVAAARAALLARIGRLLRAMHGAGFLHPDLHGGNLLLAGEGDAPDLRVIDLHGVRRLPAPAEGRRRADLAKLLHSLHTATTAAERRGLVAAYAAAGEDGDGLAADMERRMVALEEARVRSRTRAAKLFRPTGRFDVAREGDLSLVFLRSLGAGPILAALEAHRRVAADASSPDALKRGGRSTVTRVAVPGPGGTTCRLVVKETRVRGPLDLLKNALRAPRAVASWAGGNGLWHRHVDVAEPRALVVRGSWPLRRESWIVMEDVAAAGERLDLRGLRLFGSRPARPAGREKRVEVERLGRLVGSLHARGIYHGDLKAVNLFVRERHGRPSFCLVDYDRVAFGSGPVAERRRWKNLAQLAASVGDYYSRADRLRFYRACAECLPGAWEARKDAARAVAAACARKIVVRRQPIE
jgi:tRNA A-37 threonylcarbamoyl transferase component Bud32